jgi:hypothetical protein
VMSPTSLQTPVTLFAFSGIIRPLSPNGHRPAHGTGEGARKRTKTPTTLLLSRRDESCSIYLI